MNALSRHTNMPLAKIPSSGCRGYILRKHILCAIMMRMSTAPKPQATLTAAYDRTAPKRAVNVSVNADLAAKAKALGLNLSEALETRLAELIAAAERQQWLTENAEAIDAYNERVESAAILSDFERPF